MDSNDGAFSRLNAGLGAAEQRTEPYPEYGEGAVEAGTTPSVKNASSATSSASGQAGVAQGGSGFPNPATDTNIISLDLSQLLVKHPSSTFFMHVSGNAQEEQGIFDGDVAVVDRALEPKPTDLVIWWNEISFVICEHKRLPPDTAAWGTVTAIIHRFQR